MPAIIVSWCNGEGLSNPRKTHHDKALLRFQQLVSIGGFNTTARDRIFATSSQLVRFACPAPGQERSPRSPSPAAAAPGCPGRCSFASGPSGQGQQQLRRTSADSGTQHLGGLVQIVADIGPGAILVLALCIEHTRLGVRLHECFDRHLRGRVVGFLHLSLRTGTKTKEQSAPETVEQ